jgi:hypothetical protein
MEASSRLMLGEMSKDRAPDANSGGAFLDGHAKVIAYPHREGVEIDRWLLSLHCEACLVDRGIDRIAIDDSFTQITGDLSKEEQANLTASRGES